MMKIRESEIHTTDIPATTLLTHWGNEDGEMVFVSFGSREAVPPGHRELTDTLEGWRKRISSSEPFVAFESIDDETLTRLLERP